MFIVSLDLKTLHHNLKSALARSRFISPLWVCWDTICPKPNLRFCGLSQHSS